MTVVGYAEVRHLLRNLHDARALRSNSLVSRYFEPNENAAGGSDADVLARIRKVVTTTIDELFTANSTGRAGVHLERQRAILLRCDIAGEADKIVCSDLDIERRHFYREKRRARTRLAEVLATAAQPSGKAYSDTADPAELSMAHYRALRDAGETQAAIALLRSLAQNSNDRRRQIETAALLVECFAENAWWTQAFDALKTLEQLGPVEPFARARVAWAKGQIAWYHGTFSTAQDLAEEAIWHLRSATNPNSVEDDELLVTSHLQLGHCRDTIGRYDAALDAIQTASRLAASRPRLPARVRVNVLFHLGGAQSTREGGAAAAERYLCEGYAIAAQHGLARDAAGTALNLARAYMMRGKIDRALTLGREALAISRRVHGVAAYGWYSLSFAAMELAARNPRNAIELARSAASTEAYDMPRAVFARTIEANAHLQLGAASRARALAASASEQLRRHGHPRLLAYALRVLSEAAHRCGNDREAQDAIAEVFALLERNGNPYSWAYALKSRAAITGNTRYEHDATELLAALRS